jgi:N-acylglucosamine 2-epimerase
MESSKSSYFSDLYKDALLDNVIPFWMKNSKDSVNGGYFTCLERDGKVFDTDKFMWLQGRQVWTFAMLYDCVAQKEEWLQFAKHGAEFMLNHGRAKDGTWYFSATADGRPLIAPYNIFSDCFATQAFAKMHKVTNRQVYADTAISTFESILARQDNPKRSWSKSMAGTRPLKNFALPMILSSLATELGGLLDKKTKQELIDKCIHEVMDVFYHEESGLILENVQPDGSFSDSFEGRLLNPGHAIEAMWFIIDIAESMSDQALIEQAKNIVLNTLEYAWDDDYGGIFYFMDLKHKPLQQLEWDQKLWWVHIETLIALLKSYHLTGDERCEKWFDIVHEYTWAHFADKEYGEWFGYLKRDGVPLLKLKGGKWKGCYHVPRGLYQCWKTLDAINQKNK